MSPREPGRPSRGRLAHLGSTLLLSSVIVVLGVVLLVRTLAAGGGPLASGVIVGVLMAVAGAGRLWIAWRAAR